MQLMTVKIRKIMQMNVNVIIVIIAVIIIIRMMVMLILMKMINIITMIVKAMMTMKMLMLMSEGCSLHVVALLDSIWIDKNCIDFPCPLEIGPSSRFLGQPATGTRIVAGTTHTQSGRR